MKACFLQQLQLFDVTEAKGVVDEAGIGTSGHSPAHLFVVVDQSEPDLIEISPRDFVFCSPIEPVRSVDFLARLKVIPKRGDRVLVVPFGGASTHDVAAGGVDRKCRIENGSQFQVLLQIGVPFRAARLVDLVPKTGDLSKPELLVVVIHN